MNNYEQLYREKQRQVEILIAKLEKEKNTFRRKKLEKMLAKMIEARDFYRKILIMQARRQGN
jgi:hypothetical protein